MSRIFWFNVLLSQIIIITQFCRMYSTMRPTFLQSELSGASIHNNYVSRETSHEENLPVDRDNNLIKELLGRLDKIVPVFFNILPLFKPIWTKSFFEFLANRRRNPQTASLANVQRFLSIQI